MIRLQTWLALLLASGPAAAPPATRAPAAVVGLDHVPIAVADLEAAAARYRALGFTLKPGRPHANGLRNQHAKFADGTELELITAAEARDPLTRTYRQHLAQGDGPAFLALYAPSMDAASARLAREGLAHDRRGPYLDLDRQAGLGYVFLGPRNASPTDRPEHFVHANGATALIAVWLAGADLSSERRLFEALGARLTTADVRVPGPATVPAARFAEGDVLLLPAEHARVPGRRIVGATLAVRDLGVVETVLARAGRPVPHRVTTPDGSSLLLPPDETHGLWLEFRERPRQAS